MTASSAISRRRFIALAGGSTAAAAFLAACGGDDISPADGTAQFGDGEVGVLNYLLTLEFLEVAFYAALAESKLLDEDAERAVGKFGKQEEEHVAALTKAIEKMGGDPASEPGSDFSLESEEGALELAHTLENLGAAAYLGQLSQIKDKRTLGTVLSIHSVEGRHAATIADLLEKPITPDGAFAKPQSAEDVLTAVEPFMG
jgi:rubrerythrin